MMGVRLGWWGRGAPSRSVKPASFTWRLERDSGEALSAAPTWGHRGAHLGRRHCRCAGGAAQPKKKEGIQSKSFQL